jgi:C4-dicarboxylate-specific signal transduction histidine kinase
MGMTSKKYNQQQKNLCLGFLFAVLCASILVSFSIKTVRESIKDEHSVGHSHQVKSAMFQFLSDAGDALSSERGYMLTASELDKSTFEKADSKISTDFILMQSLMTDNAKQMQLLNVLNENVALFQKRTRAAFVNRDTHGLGYAIAGTKKGRGRQRMSTFKEILGAINAEEDRVLSEHIEMRKTESTKAEDLILLGGVLFVSLLAGSLVIMLRDMKKINLHNQQMAEKSKAAALGEMAGGIAHEINNPLAVIRAHAQLLGTYCKQGELQPSLLQKSAGKIDETVQRIAQIVKGMLMLARNVESDNKKAILLAEVIESSLEMSRNRFHGKHVELRVFNPTDSLLIHCRPIELSQVLINLLNNAFDAVSDCPNPWVELKVEEIEDHIRISVTDGGKGISLTNRSRIMEPFFSTKEAGRGTGLGLSVSKAIIESHGGNFLLNDKIKHTCFEIHLPKGLASPQMTL